MIRGSAPAGLLTGLIMLIMGLVACDEGRAPLDLDELITPDFACVELVHESLDLGDPIVAFASDTAGSPGGWALVSTDVPDGEPMLTLVRVPATADEPSTAPIVVANSVIEPQVFRLRAGLELGTAWLLGESEFESGPVVLRKLAPGVGVVASNALLANFPADDGEAGCPDRWWRQLVLIEGRPFMLALPDCADGPSVELQLLALDEQNLDYQTNWTLTFDPPCSGDDPLACADAYAYRLDAINPGQSTHLPDASRVAIGFTQVRAFDQGLPSEFPIALSSDISLLDLRVNANGPEARLLTFREVWINATPFPLGPVELGQDHHSLQIFVANLVEQPESVLLRLDLLTDTYLPASGADVLPYAGEGTLIQLAEDSAMLHLDADHGRLLASPLADVPVWGSFASQLLYEQDDLIGFESAGPGMLLLHRSNHPEQILHVACMPD